MNARFVIHPKSKISKAFDVGDGKYGANEVLYPSDAKFKYIGKIQKEVRAKDYINPKYNKDTGSFMAWEIHLQEV